MEITAFKPEQNGWLYEDIFRYINLDFSTCSSGAIDVSPFVQVTPWWGAGDKPLPEATLTKFSDAYVVSLCHNESPFLMVSTGRLWFHGNSKTQIIYRYFKVSKVQHLSSSILMFVKRCFLITSGLILRQLISPESTTSYLPIQCVCYGFLHIPWNATQ